MNLITRVLCCVLITCSVALGSQISLAASSTPAAAEFYPLVGHWHGSGQLSEPGQAPVKLTLKLSCQKVSSGWAVRCAMQARNNQMLMSESDLMGVDPVTGQAHWYAITNQGETHDHLATWLNAHTMKAHYDWNQDGKHMREDITFNLKGKQTMNFQSVVTANAKQAGEFSGKLKQ